MTSPASHSHCTNRLAAIALASMSVLVLVALFHHPVVGHHADAGDMLGQLAQLRVADQSVHAALIAMLTILASALGLAGQALGGHRAVSAGALGAYCLGCVLLGVAMLFDGFVVPRLAVQFLATAPENAAAGMLVLRAVSVMIQVLTKAGLIAQSLAMLAWAYAAATGSPALPRLRWVAIVGVLAGAVPAAVIVSTDLRLEPQSLMALFAAQAAWYLVVAWQLAWPSCRADPAAGRVTP